MNEDSEYRRAMATWNRLCKVTGRPQIHGASALLDKHGYFGGVADELSPATEEGRVRIRMLVARAIRLGWCERHTVKVKQEPPHGKFDLPEARCGKCGARPSYCRCGKGGLQT